MSREPGRLPHAALPARPGAARLVLDIDFGAGGTSAAHTLEGWGAQEATHRWSIGRTSRLRLPIAAADADHVVVFDVVPWLHPPALPAQRVMVGVNDRLADTLAIGHDMAFAVRVPAGSARDGHAEVSLLHLDCERGAAIDTYRDGSAMGLMVHRVWVARAAARAPAFRPSPAALAPVPGAGLPTGPAARALLAGFESLGHRCAFGLLQAHHGTDPLDLLRFAGIHTPTLVRQLLRQFDGLGRAEDLHAFIRKDAQVLYSLYDRAREVWFNTTQAIGTVPEAEVIRTASARLDYLRRRFLAGLAAGQRSYIVNSPLPMVQAEALALGTALDLSGPNTLVWTNQAGPAAPGSVVRTAPGLYYGQLDAAGAVPGDPSAGAWLSVCANAAALRLAEQGAAP